MEQYRPIHPLKVNKVHAAEHLLHSSSIFENIISRDMKCGQNLQMFWREELAVSTIKMEEPTTSYFMVEKKG
jgi:hypothetical protein